MRIVQFFGSKSQQQVKDGFLEILRAGQPGAEQVSENRQLGPRASFVLLVANVRYHLLGDRPIARDLISELVGQLTLFG